MISRRKFLQGALGFASAAILPSGIIMPIKPPIARDEYGVTFTLGNMDSFDRVVLLDQNGTILDENQISFLDEGGVERKFPNQFEIINDLAKKMDDANVPFENRWVWMPD